jgi:predicted ATPase
MLAGMSFYDIAPESVRELQPADSRAILRRDGSNLAGVLERLSRQSPETYQRLLEYLGAIVPDLLDVRRESYGSHETLLFRQRSPGGSAPWEFRAAHMSDGTLRALALLVAVMQRRSDGRAMTVVGVEEPECAIHPAAMAAMLDALREAAVETQVLVTTQSPDVLDLVELEDETLLAVAKRDGASVIAPVDPAGVDVLQQRLYTPGEMLRMNHLEPAPAHPGPTPARALSEVRSA